MVKGMGIALSLCEGIVGDEDEWHGPGGDVSKAAIGRCSVNAAEWPLVYGVEMPAGLFGRLPGLKKVSLCGGMEGYMVVSIGRVPSLL